MSGAMAGSAIVGAQARRDSLGTVTLTINNVCNLSCAHCYLQYDGREGLIDQDVINHIFESDFERICVVGKEPLANRASADTAGRIVDLASRKSRAVA